MVERSQQEVWRLTPWLAVVLCVAMFILMAYDARDSGNQRIIRVWAQTAADFVQSPVTTITSGISGYFGSIANLRGAQNENETLRQRVQELEVEVKAKSDLAAENERLSALLDLKEKSQYKVLTARIIGRDPSIWFDSSIVNRGSLDGVKLYMPVVTNGGLLGKVSAVGPLTSQVDLLTREGSGVGAVVGEIAGSSALGVVSGSSKRDILEMRYVSGSVDVQVGQIVYTSGQDGIYPAGLKVGEIVQIETGSATTPHKISIKPSAGIDSMQEVGILLYEPPVKEEFEQKINKAPKPRQ